LGSIRVKVLLDLNAPLSVILREMLFRTLSDVIELLMNVKEMMMARKWQLNFFVF